MNMESNQPKASEVPEQEMKTIKTANPLPCGCGIKGTPRINDDATRMEYKDMFIDFCPTHAAAPALYVFLKAERDRHVEAAKRANFSGCACNTCLVTVPLLQQVESETA